MTIKTLTNVLQHIQKISPLQLFMIFLISLAWKLDLVVSLASILTHH